MNGVQLGDEGFIGPALLREATPTTASPSNLAVSQLMTAAQQEDPWNSIAAGAATGGFLQLRTGMRSAAKSAAFGGVLLVSTPSQQPAALSCWLICKPGTYRCALLRRASDCGLRVLHDIPYVWNLLARYREGCVCCAELEDFAT